MVERDYVKEGFEEWKSRREEKINVGNIFNQPIQKANQKVNPIKQKKEISKFLKQRVSYKSILKKTPRATYVIR